MTGPSIGLDPITGLNSVIFLFSLLVLHISIQMFCGVVYFPGLTIDSAGASDVAKP